MRLRMLTLTAPFQWLYMFRIQEVTSSKIPLQTWHRDMFVPSLFSSRKILRQQVKLGQFISLLTVWFEENTVVLINIMISRDMTQWWLVIIYKRFGGTWCIFLLDRCGSKPTLKKAFSKVYEKLPINTASYLSKLQYSSNCYLLSYGLMLCDASWWEHR